ncbi:MAG TPA: hypothetical protein VGQ28_06360 [Thermoanaerobaculia bacterium]|jgi:hypothetical protein|nr:hypothetical protein [Thermoanaerobaculia bacterium]
MNPRPSLLLVISAVLYFAGALPLLFAPEELLTFAGSPPSILDTTLLQVLGSAIFGFAMLNWLNRYSRVGGIFGRPLVAANLAHTGSAALLLGHIVRRAPFSPLLLGVMALYGALAVAFGYKFFVQPSPAADRES